MKALYGRRFPLMSMNERILNLSAMGLVDDIVFDVPFVVSKSMLNQLNIDQGAPTSFSNFQLWKSKRKMMIFVIMVSTRSKSSRRKANTLCWEVWRCSGTRRCPIGSRGISMP